MAQKHNAWTVFQDFLTISAISISNTADPYNLFTPKQVQAEREKRYLETYNKYDNNEQKLLQKMFAELVMEMESNCVSGEHPHLVDVLGELFRELKFHDKWRGQFFTPQSVADLMGEMAVNGNAKVDREIAEKGYFTVSEPCCGAGALIYGMANAMCKNGLNYNKDVLVIARDIDERCVLMTYIQCDLYGIPAIVQQIDSIRNKVLTPSWYTLTFMMYSWKWNRFFEGEKSNESQLRG